MKHIIRFVIAIIYATIKGAAVSFDYSEHHFAEPDWDCVSVVPRETTWDIAIGGIIVDGEFYAWKYCYGFQVCPYHHDKRGVLHLGLSMKTF